MQICQNVWEIKAKGVVVVKRIFLGNVAVKMDIDKCSYI